MSTFAGALKSKTITVNTALAALLPMLEYAQTQIPLLQSVLPENVYMYAFGFTVLANIVLRFYTVNALSAK